MMEVLLVIITIMAVVATVSAYHNGCTDGYGYAREPEHPGYQRAGKYLRKFMAHRWPELRNAEEITVAELKHRYPEL
jgi:hypothetical protein